MFSEFSKDSILTIGIRHLSSTFKNNDFEKEQKIFHVTVSALTSNSVGLDILNKNKDYLVVLDVEAKNISSSNLSIRDRIFKPLSNLRHNDISYANNCNYRAMQKVLKYLGLNLPKELNSLNAFKKYIDKNRG